MHTGPIPESAGTLGKPEARLYNCRKCGGVETVEAMPWDNAGGYDDYKMHCTKCDATWWEEGADA